MNQTADPLPRIAFEHSYAALPDRFYTRVHPTPVREPTLIRLNTALAEHLGLDPAIIGSPAGVAMLAGNHVPGEAQPLAMAYAGHQFGGWVPQLGDGRAVLLGELIGTDGSRHDVQLKGAGRTPYSRGGDGRAWLGPVLREYLVSEAMAALGIPTTRALAAVATGEPVLREQGALPGAVLTRVASSHVRVGTFQFFAARQDIEALSALTDHVIARHYPALTEAHSPALALLDAVMDAQSKLVAQWLGVGFIHGVMNTDNTSVAGITIDYGPCAFLDTYEPDKTFSSIDRMHRYAYDNQSAVLQWNLANLAQCLLPLIDADEQQALDMAQALVNGFPERCRRDRLAVMRRKLGLDETLEGTAVASTTDRHAIDAADTVLIDDLLDIMAAQEADFTETFRRLSWLESEPGAADEVLKTVFANGDALTGWLARWRERLTGGSMSQAQRMASMQQANPTLIPRNHQVEKLIVAATEGDFAPFHELLDVLQRPFDELDPQSAYRQAPTSAEVVTATFCGT